MKKFKVSEDVTIEALGPNEAQDPLIYIVFDDHPDCQSIPLYAHQVKALVAALVDAGAWLADQVGGEP